MAAGVRSGFSRELLVEFSNQLQQQGHSERDESGCCYLGCCSMGSAPLRAFKSHNRNSEGWVPSLLGLL